MEINQKALTMIRKLAMKDREAGVYNANVMQLSNVYQDVKRLADSVENSGDYLRRPFLDRFKDLASDLAAWGEAYGSLPPLPRKRGNPPPIDMRDGFAKPVPYEASKRFEKLEFSDPPPANVVPISRAKRKLDI